MILKKSAEDDMNLPEEFDFMIAQRLRNNVRQISLALNRLKAMQQLKGGDIDIDLVRETLNHIMALQERLVSNAIHSKSCG